MSAPFAIVVRPGDGPLYVYGPFDEDEAHTVVEAIKLNPHVELAVVPLLPWPPSQMDEGVFT